MPVIPNPKKVSSDSGPQQPGRQLVQWNVLMAATLLAALPTLLVYIFLGRYFLRGLMAGALKG